MQKRLPYIPAENGQVDDLIVDLPRDTYAPIARFFADLAKTFDDRATLHDLAKLRESDAARVLKGLNSLGAVVAVLMAEGQAYDRIVQELEAQGVPAETTYRYYQRHQRAQARIARAQRNREILRLAARGWDNDAIARRFGLHPGSVSRLIQRELRRTGQSAQRNEVP